MGVSQCQQWVTDVKYVQSLRSVCQCTGPRGCNTALTFAAYPQPTPNTVASSPKFRNSTIKRQRTIVCLGAKGVGMCLLLCLLRGESCSHTSLSCHGSTLSQGSLRRCNNTAEKSFLRVCIHAPPALSISLSTIVLNWSSLLDLSLHPSHDL